MKRGFRIPAAIGRTADLVWTQHPAWCPHGDTSVRVIDMPDTSRWAAIATHGTGRDSLEVVGLDSADMSPIIDEYRLDASIAGLSSDVTARLRAMGTVVRLRTPDLWEAICVAIVFADAAMRHRWSAYKAMCAELGELVPLPQSPHYRMCPGPDAMAAETASYLSGFGLSEAVADTLLTAADVYMDRAEAWHDTPPDALAAALHRSVDGLTPDTAHAVVADITGDHTHTAPPGRDVPREHRSTVAALTAAHDWRTRAQKTMRGDRA